MEHYSLIFFVSFNPKHLFIFFLNASEPNIYMQKFEEAFRT